MSQSLRDNSLSGNKTGSSEYSPALSSILSMFPENFTSRSWVDIVEEEEEYYASLSSSQTSDADNEAETNEVENPVLPSETTDSSKLLKQEPADYLEESDDNPDIIIIDGMPSSSRRSSRKSAAPKRNDTQPKYARSIAMAEAMNNVNKAKNEALNSSPNSSQKRKRPIVSDSDSRRRSARVGISDAVTSAPKKTNLKRRRTDCNDSTNSNRQVNCGFIFKKEEPLTDIKGKSYELAPTPLDGWVEPSLGWCHDKKILERREKEIDRMKEKPTYERYISEVPKHSRDKKVHPKTPNKYINYSRRSWDTQIKKWKLAIYDWAGESPSASANASYCSSECSDQEDNISDTPSQRSPSRRSLSSSVEGSSQLNSSCESLNNSRRKRGGKSKSSSGQKPSSSSPSQLLRDITIALNSPDTIASMIGHFDIESTTMKGMSDATLKGDETCLSAGSGCCFSTTEESTLKADPTVVKTEKENEQKKGKFTVVGRSYAQAAVRGPIDFSHLSNTKK